MPPITSLASPSYVHDPSKLQYVEARFKNDRGKSMFYCAFFPPATSQVPLRGVVLFLHGIGEHSHRFTHVYEQLCANNYGVIAYDMIAHGRSDCEVEGVRGHGEKFQHFVDDTNRFISVAKESVIPQMLPASSRSVTPPPLIFMGISFGCLVGLHTILSKVHQFRAAVLASPAISVEYTLILRMMSVLSKSLSWLIPTAKIVPGVNFAGASLHQPHAQIITKLVHNFVMILLLLCVVGLCRDPAFVENYMADPLNVTDNLTARMGEQAMTAMNALAANRACEDPNSSFCAISLLIVQGTGDIVTSVPLARAFYNRIATKDKEFKEYKGLFHCIFNEPEKQEVMDYITQWLDARTSDSPASASAMMAQIPSKL
ncbi:Serine protease family s33, partial [Globisporangium splendens]